MKLYHVGFDIIKEPDINAGRKNADFGKGFYLSDNKEFSIRWAKQRKGLTTYINIYELDTDGLNIKKLRKDKHWFKNIYLNRLNVKDIYADYDVVIGPIANDTIFDTLGIITSGIFSDKESLQLMKVGNRYTQVVIKSEKALNNLKWETAEEINDEDIDGYRELVKKEEVKYQQKLADVIEKF